MSRVPSDLCAHATRLAHDVGKHGARAARNLEPDAAASEALADMLIADLYALAGGERASRLFARLAEPLRAAQPDARLERCTALLAQVDALEAQVRARDAAALAHAAACMREVETLLFAVARAHCPHVS
jgi:hypothetical protein